MVFFTCNHCGESLKKAAVEKHYQFKACRNGPIFLTCVDCLKDFREQEYVAHTKCVSEAERYAAKGTFSAKPDKNKGAQKQEIWTECIQELSERPNIDKTLRNVLQRIASQTNVPRKKPKFINFLKSSMKYPVHQAEKVWTTIEDGLEEFKKRSVQSAPASKKEDEPITDENGNDNSTKSESKVATNDSDDDVTLGAVLQHALSNDDLTKSIKKSLKKLKKASDIPLDAKPPKKKKMMKLLQEKIELDADDSAAVWNVISLAIDALGQNSKSNGTNGTNGTNVTKGTKKRKINEVAVEAEAKAKKPKKENGITESNQSSNDTTFDWQKHILRIFTKSQQNNELAIDSLRLKVVKKFLKETGAPENCTEKYYKQFKKQLKKVDSLTTAGDLVQLKG